MKEDRFDLADRDEELGRWLSAAEPRRARSEAEWVSLESRISAAAELPLARIRRRAWLAPVLARAEPLAAAAAVVLVVLGTWVYATPRPVPSFADVASELIELIGEDEVRSFFPGADDPDRLLQAALAAR
jgi:hypothetical protein